MSLPAEVLSSPPAPLAREAARKTVELIVIEGGKNVAQQAAKTGFLSKALRLLRVAGSRALGTVGAIFYSTSLNEGEDEWLEANHLYHGIPNFNPDIVQKCEDCDEEKNECVVGTYDEIKNACQTGSQAHHIVPDFTLRYGTRGQGDKRIPNMPSLGDGPSICLVGSAFVQGTEHYEAQTMGDAAITQLGIYQQTLYPEVPAGTAPIGKVAMIATLHTASVKPACALQIAAAVEAAFPPANHDQLVRTIKNTLPSGDTLVALSEGKKFSDYYPSKL